MKKYYSFLIILLFVAGAFLRLYNLPDRLIFGPEQGISLLTAAANLDKFSLLGEYNLQRLTSTGLNLIHGPLLSYFLLPFILLFDFRVFPITIVFVFLNLFSALLLFHVSNKFFGRTVAVLTLFYFLFSALMIYHSLFIWIYHPLILLGVLAIWFVGNQKIKPHSLNPSFWLGLISGVGFSLQYPFLLTGGFLFFLTLLLSKKRLSSSMLFISAFFLANFTRVIFDLRHDFFHLRVLWQYFVDVYIEKTIGGQLYSYHYLQFFPLFSLVLAVLSVGFAKIRKPLIIIPVVVYLYLNFASPLFNLNKSLGMPEGITLASLETAAFTIASDDPPDRFNVATLWDFDTLARPIRYLLQYYYGQKAQSFADYAAVDALYVFAPVERDINNPKVWELNTFKPYRVTILTSPSVKYRLYKLTK